jgi:dihydrofolate reductase
MTVLKFMKISIIVAVDENSLIGKGGSLPWHLPADLKHFKEVTMGHHILFGQTTYESINHPLPGRTNIILSDIPNYKSKGCVVVGSPKETIEYAKAKDENELFVCGGAMVYKTFLPLVDRIYLTMIRHKFEGDTYFPEIDKKKWKLVSKKPHRPDSKNPYRYDFLVYERNGVN